MWKCKCCSWNAWGIDSFYTKYSYKRIKASHALSPCSSPTNIHIGLNMLHAFTWKNKARFAKQFQLMPLRLCSLRSLRPLRIQHFACVQLPQHVCNVWLHDLWTPEAWHGMTYWVTGKAFHRTRNCGWLWMHLDCRCIKGRWQQSTLSAAPEDTSGFTSLTQFGETSSWFVTVVTQKMPSTCDALQCRFYSQYSPTMSYY